MHLFKEVRSWFTPRYLNTLLDPPEHEVQKLAREYLLQSGSRWRPLLTASAWVGGSGKPTDELLSKRAIAVECFHKASLIHDDIEDGDDMRGDQMALHTRIGIPMAINVGDYLIHEGYRSIWTSGPAVQICSVAQRAMCIGQHMDLGGKKGPSVATYKTGACFHMALRMGWVFDAVELSDALGIAYQAKDDGSKYSTTKVFAALKRLGNPALAKELKAVVEAMLK